MPLFVEFQKNSAKGFLKSNEGTVLIIQKNSESK